MTTMTANEQMLLEMTNRARMNPTAEAARQGISLNQFIHTDSSGFPITADAKQVLAGSNVLQSVAENHVAVVFANPHLGEQNFDPHNGAGDGSVVARIAAAGYSQNALSFYRPENFVEFGTSNALTATELQTQVENSHNALFVDDPAHMFGEPGGHRLAMMDPNMKEMGVGTTTGTLHGFNTVMSFENFGVSGAKSFLTGAVYDDTVKADHFYTIGEGTSTVKATVTNAAGAVVGADVTGGGGGWSVAETGGTFSVTFTGHTLGHAVSAKVSAGNLNAKVDLVNGTEIDANVSTILGSGAKDLRLLGIADINGTGNASSNKLVGNAGDNHLTGGSGHDVLTGGLGDDTFVFKNLSDSKSLIANSDRITDFHHTTQHDHIDLHALDANSGASGNQSFHFIGTHDYSHHAGELQYEISGANTRVRADVNGDGHSDFSITLSGHHTLHAADFIL